MKDNTDITSAGIEIYRHDINYYADEYIKNELELEHVDQESKRQLCGYVILYFRPYI